MKAITPATAAPIRDRCVRPPLLLWNFPYTHAPIPTAKTTAINTLFIILL